VGMVSPDKPVIRARSAGGLALGHRVEVLGPARNELFITVC